ncbi:Multidrug export protein MepA [Poriferisphaera corsica]|uniref:Multidrug export protein MepA n=1 Tax=Poriferisphaera corsica TaxID=2528020 RepID=A0A517YP79_9BACT|nr:MATE family efflux transporter [Poriferisphaera corsica]QDU32019.1 Multidrug export protein MepA [Poriferisphaera corsica]
MSAETSLNEQAEMAVGKMAHLGEKPVLGLLMGFFAPAMVGMMTHALYNLVDKIYVGQGVGAIGLGALTVVFPVMMVGFGVSLLYGAGGAALISLRMGEGKVREAEKYLSGAIGMSLLMGVVLVGVVMWWQEDVLRLFGANDELMGDAKAYLFWILVGFPMLSAGFVMNFAIRAEGRPTVSVVIMMISTVVNIVLDPILIFGLEMGVAGAALATCLSQTVTLMLGVVYYAGGWSVLKVKMRLLLPRWGVLRPMLLLGLPACLADALFAVQQLFMNQKLVEHGGTMGVAAMGVIFGVMTVAVMPMFAMGDGLQPVVGFNYGAKLYGRVREALLWTSGLVWLLGGVMILPVVVWPELFVWMFTGGDEALMVESVRGLRVFSLGVPLFGMCFVMTRYYQAIGRGGIAMVLSTLKPLVMFVPPLYVMAWLWGMKGVWASEPVSGVLSMVVVGWVMLLELRSGRGEAAAVEA